MNWRIFIFEECGEFPAVCAVAIKVGFSFPVPGWDGFPGCALFDLFDTKLTQLEQGRFLQLAGSGNILIIR